MVYLLEETMKNVIKELKKDNQDFEFYPTTDEILTVIVDDIFTLNEFDEGKKNKIKIRREYYRDNNDELRTKRSFIINKFLDIGTGDGRIFDFMANSKIMITNKQAIEKSRILSSKLIRKDIQLIGIDYYESVLMGNQYDIVFSNPPYSSFKEWTFKMMEELNSYIIYLVIPSRWKDDSELVRVINSRGDVTVLGDFDFLKADRVARAKVDVIKIKKNYKKKNTISDSFENWVVKNIGEFETTKTEFINKEPVKKGNELQEKKVDLDNLVFNYEEELSVLMESYIALGKVDFNLLSLLGVSKAQTLLKIKSDIQGLKTKYWKIAFDTLKAITSKLTYNKRRDILEKINWFKELDFNKSNIQTVIIWTIENYNKFSDEQLLEIFDNLTNKENVKAYKSNEKWLTDDWRYTKPIPTKYSLDYRIIVPRGYKFSSMYYYPEENIVSDLSTVANVLGFKNKGFFIENEKLETSKKYYVYTNDDNILFEFKYFKNNNVHFKLDQKLMMKLNIEAGKLRGWIKKPKDIVDEFNIKEEEAVKLFGDNKYLKLGEVKQLLLSS